MKIFTIDAENNVVAHASADDAGAVRGTESFTTTAGLKHVTAGWPAGRLRRSMEHPARCHSGHQV